MTYTLCVLPNGSSTLLSAGKPPDGSVLRGEYRTRQEAEQAERPYRLVTSLMGWGFKFNDDLWLLQGFQLGEDSNGADDTLFFFSEETQEGKSVSLHQWLAFIDDGTVSADSLRDFEPDMGKAITTDEYIDFGRRLKRMNLGDLKKLHAR